MDTSGRPVEFFKDGFEEMQFPGETGEQEMPKA